MTSPIAGTGTIGKTALPSLVFRDPAVLSLLSLGEEVKVAIIQRLSDRQYLVGVKDRMILADSEAPLKAGTELRVHVDQEHPRLVLRILSESGAPGNIFTENLRFFRSNPHGLLINLTQVEALLAQAVLHPQLSLLLQEDIRILLPLMQTIRYSRNAAGNRNYLRDYPHDLGLHMESDLKKALPKGERGLQNDHTPGGVKGRLLHLVEKVSALLGDETLPEEIRLSLTPLQSSAEKSLKTIENQQILNVFLQETENTYMLQIPLQFPGGMKVGEIFVRTDDHDDPHAGGQKSFTVVLLFELDMLGHLLVEVHAHDKKLDCLCKCEGEAVREFISSRLPELQEQLFSVGYRVERLTCVVEQDVEKQQSACRQQYRLYTDESINLFA